MPSSANDFSASLINSSGNIGVDYYTASSGEIWPTLYLKSSVKITPNQNPEQEYGTVDNPFQLSISE